MQVDAVEIVSRLLGGDRELGLVDQPLEVGGRQLETVGHLAGGEIGKVALRQGLQREARAAGADRQRSAVAGGFEHDLRALRQLAHDLVEHVRRHGGRAAGADLGRDRLGHFEVEIGGLEGKLGLLGPDQHVGEDRNRVAALDHAMDVAQRLQQLCAFDRDLHDEPRSIGGALRLLKGRQKWLVGADSARAREAGNAVYPKCHDGRFPVAGRSRTLARRATAGC